MQKIAVVTGASSGIGEATARRFAAEGFHVVAVARRADRLAALVKEIGPAATAVECDVTSDDAVARLAAEVTALGGPVSVLVNNAGGARGLDPVATGSRPLAPPALLTSTLTGPPSAVTSAASRATASSDVTSHSTAVAAGPISFTSAARRSARRATATT